MPWHEPRPAPAGAALRVQLESQFRGSAGTWRANPPDVAGDGRGRRHPWMPRRCPVPGLMQRFTALDAVAAPLAQANLDTDQILPGRFLKTITRDGLGRVLFSAIRFDEDGAERPASSSTALLGGSRNPDRARQFRLRLQPGARTLGTRRLRHSRDNRPKLRRHLPEQLLQERPTTDRARTSAGPRAIGACRRTGDGTIVHRPDRAVYQDLRGETIGFQIAPEKKAQLLLSLDEIAATETRLPAIEAFEARACYCCPPIRLPA